MNRSSVAKRRILAVDDELEIALVCRRALGSESYRVDVAASGAIAGQMLIVDDEEKGLSNQKVRWMLCNMSEVYLCPVKLAMT